jgi:hypothetical protein
MEMYAGECPVLKVVRTWMKDPSLEDMARRYWKKRSYFYQGFVRESPFRESDAPTNPVRQFIIGPQIHNLIRNMLIHKDLLESPCDYERGMNFTIKKTDKMAMETMINRIGHSKSRQSLLLSDTP